MGSATREALAGTREAIAQIGAVDLAVAADLLSVTRLVAGSPQLRSALTDTEADADQKRALVRSVFGGRIVEPALVLLSIAATRRWSSHDDFVAGLEDLGLRAAAAASSTDVELDAELFSFERTVASDPGLELALGSKLGSTDAKVVLVDRLLDGKSAPATGLIVRHLVQEPRGRRIGEMLRDAASVVADQRGFDVATVTTAVPLSDDQLARLERGLSVQAGRRIRLDRVVDPSLIGGVRVQLGDDVIDGSVATRINSLRQKLAG